mmetsp:Transcript_24544/g.45014  ORF Transcript_24544/g.45014 Transcript_24544/m.45014 type:complete len:202 (-) Transcript_24544:630-1235(-)
MFAPFGVLLEVKCGKAVLLLLVGVFSSCVAACDLGLESALDDSTRSALESLGRKVDPSKCTTTAVISSDIIPSVSACHRFRATPAISRAADSGLSCLDAISTASCEETWSQTPSEPRTKSLSRLSSFLSMSSGWELTKGRKLRSPKDRDIANPPNPLRLMTLSGPPRSQWMPPLCMTGKDICSTVPPAATILARSSCRLGL